MQGSLEKDSVSSPPFCDLSGKLRRPAAEATAKHKAASGFFAIMLQGIQKLNRKPFYIKNIEQYHEI